MRRVVRRNRSLRRSTRAESIEPWHCIVTTSVRCRPTNLSSHIIIVSGGTACGCIMLSFNEPTTTAENIAVFLLALFSLILCASTKLPSWIMPVYIAVFVASRLAHTVCMTLALQPWRYVISRSFSANGEPHPLTLSPSPSIQCDCLHRWFAGGHDCAGCCVRLRLLVDDPPLVHCHHAWLSCAPILSCLLIYLSNFTIHTEFDVHIERERSWLDDCDSPRIISLAS